MGGYSETRFQHNSTIYYAKAWFFFLQKIRCDVFTRRSASTANRCIYMDDVRGPMKKYDACEAMHLILGDESKFSFLEPFHVVVVWTDCLVVCLYATCVRVCSSRLSQILCVRERWYIRRKHLSCSLVRARACSLSFSHPPTHFENSKNASCVCSSGDGA